MFKFIRLFFLFVFSFILITACKKNGFGNVEGKVFENGTSTPIANAKIKLSWKDGNKEWESNTVTDKNGFYHLKYRKKIGIKYSITASSINYHSMAQEFNYNIEYRRSDVNIYLNPLAKIQFRVINSTASTFMININNQFNYTTIPNKDTILPYIMNASGYGRTQFYYTVNGSPFYHDVYIYQKNAVYTYTISIN